VAVAWEFKWPAPEDGYFEVAAQINAALLVTTGLTVAAPTAWRRTPQAHFAWISTGPIAAVLGLGASIAGVIGPGDVARGLFVVSIAAVMPVLLALLTGVYDRLNPQASTTG